MWSIEAVGKVCGLATGQASPELTVNAGRLHGGHLQTRREEAGSKRHVRERTFLLGGKKIKEVKLKF